jgi:hypothetical protein
MYQPAELSRPLLHLYELPSTIAEVLSGRQEPCSVRELHRALLEHYRVDFGLVLAVVLYQTARGELTPVACGAAHKLNSGRA